MRFAVLFLLMVVCLGCASGGTFVDSRGGGVPFVIVGAGFPEVPEIHVEGAAPRQGLRFVFTNVSNRPQTIERVTLRQRDSGSSRLRIDPASEKINRMIDSGDDVEIDVRIRVGADPRAQRPKHFPALEIDAYLVLGDGTRYYYPVAIRTAV